MNNNRRLPAEWELQSGIQLTWPHEDSDWAYILDDVTKCYVNVATEIARRQHLVIACRDIALVRSLLADANLENISFYQVDCNDTWARDHGGITVLRDGFAPAFATKGFPVSFDNTFIQSVSQTPIVCDFCFNGWGKKFEAGLDNLVTSSLAKSGTFNSGVELEDHLDFVLEGGSIESDGEGTILTTSECLLSKNRNEQFSRTQIEEKLKSYFGAERVLWIDHGYLAGDDTDSHVDTLARLCSPDTIAYVSCFDWNDEHYSALSDMYKDLSRLRTAGGQPYRLVALPMADCVIVDGERLPATYANFLIMNNAVLMPTYGTDKDAVALRALQIAFPGYEIVGIDCSSLIRQHGSLHCITMQYPAGVLV